MVYRFGGFELDGETLELRGPGGVVAMEPLTFEALLYLVENRSRVVSKDELATAVWKARYVSDAAITRCLSGVRRAVGDDGREGSVIRTFYGRGYRFVAPVEEGGAPSGTSGLGGGQQNSDAPPRNASRVGWRLGSAIATVMAAAIAAWWGLGPRRAAEQDHEEPPRLFNFSMA